MMPPPFMVAEMGTASIPSANRCAQITSAMIFRRSGPGFLQAGAGRYTCLSFVAVIK